MKKFLQISLIVATCLTASACDSVPERVEKHYARGAELLEQGAPEKAVLEFRNALKLDENHAPSRLAIAKLYEADQELPAALSNYRLVTELDPENTEALLGYARLLLLAGDAERAQAPLLKAREILPESPEAWALSAIALQGAGEQSEAAEAARMALELRPGDVQASLVLAQQSMDAGDADAALALLDGPISQSPEEPAPWLLKLQALRLKDDDAAIGRTLEAMTAQFPDEPQPKRMLASWRLSQGDDAGALEIIRALFAAEPDNADIALDAVRLVGRIDGREEAERELARLIAESGSDELAMTLSLALAETQWNGGRAAEATETLRQAVATQSEPAQANRARARLAAFALADNDQAGASSLIEEMLSTDPRNVDALALRAAVAIEDDRPADALRDLGVAADESPDDVRVTLLAAQAHSRLGETELATESLAAATRASNYAPAVVSRYVEFLIRQDRAEAARTVMEEAIARRPDDNALMLALAQMRLRDGDWRGAREIAARLEDAPNGRALAERVRAAVAAGQGDLDDSISILRQMSDQDERAGGLTSALVSAYVRNGQVEAAEALVSDRLATDPNDLEALLLQAELKLLRGDLQGSRDVISRVIKAAPQVPTGYVALARLNLSQGDVDAALTAAEDAIEKAADPAPGLLLVAQIKESRGEWDDAISAYERLYALNGASEVVANNLASLLAEHRSGSQKDLSRAATIAQRLRDSRVPEFLDTYGWVAFLKGDQATARAALAKAADGAPRNPWIRFHYGEALAAAGEAEMARGHLQAALDLAPDFPKADAVRRRLTELGDAP